MRTLLATAELADVHWAAAGGLLDGILTTPLLLQGARPPRDHRERLRELAHAAPLPLYAAVHAVDADDMYRDARDLARISDQIVVQLPLIEDALPVVSRLCTDGVRVAMMFVFDAAQAVLAAKAGATAVLVDLAALEQAGHDGPTLLRQMRRVLDAAAPECAVVALEPDTPGAFAECALAGADACAVTPALLRTLLQHPLTDRGVDRFLAVLASRGRGGLG